MHPITCPACGHEFGTPAPGQAGPECPRCGEPTRRPVVTGVGAATYLSAALGGTFLGLLAAAILLISRS
jgi:hypothetical protein